MSSQQPSPTNPTARSTEPALIEHHPVGARLAAALAAWTLVLAALAVYSVVESAGGSIVPYPQSMAGSATWLLGGGIAYLALAAGAHALLCRAVRRGGAVGRNNVASLLVAHLAVLIAAGWSLGGTVQSRGLLVGLDGLITCLGLAGLGSLLLGVAFLASYPTATRSQLDTPLLRLAWPPLILAALIVLFSTLHLESRPLANGPPRTDAPANGSPPAA